VINTEFKFDLMDYMARYPNAPVHSLNEILEQGNYHAALEAGFKQSDAIATRDSEAYRAALRQRDVVRELVTAALEGQTLDALAFPVLSRKAAIIGEPVRGLNNCQVSASTGLPAISIPAGFTPDGVPIGMELLGPAWSESRLLSIAFAYEQAAAPRRTPSTTPPLVDRKAPAPRRIALTLGDLRASFAFDPITGRLSYETSSATPHVGAAVAAVHRGGEGARGPIILTIAGGSIARTGDAVLQPADQRALQKGELYVEMRSGTRMFRAQLRP
jgi:hypothetical protein